jgi:hypothetical protein
MRVKRILLEALSCLLFMLAVIPTTVNGQNVTGTILGAVKEQSGAVVPGATVTITNAGTGLVRTVKTDNSGQYLSSELPLGIYEVRAEGTGFGTAIKTGIELTVDARVTIDFSLAVGSVQQAVTVTGAEPLVKLASPDIGYTLTSHSISQLPLSTRNFVDLISLTTGVTNGTPGENLQGGLPQSQPFGRTAFNVNGLRTDANNFSMDGVDINDPVLSGLIISPPLDAIGEFKLEQSVYSAEFGRAAGGVINLQMKSGTNKFHGELFEFARNKAFTARSYFDATNPPFVQNQFGGILGGPIRKDKIFFFTDYQGTRIRQGQTYIETVPTAAQRAGNLSDQLPIFDPNTVTGVSPTGLQIRAPFPGNQIPASRINASTGLLLAALPSPNLGGTVNNFRTSVSNGNDFDGGDIRVDGLLPRSGNIFARYSVNNARIITPAVFGILGGDPLLSGDSSTEGQNIAIGYTAVLSPSIVNELRVGFTRKGQHILNTSNGEDLSNQFGLPGFNLGTYYTAGLANITGAGIGTIGSSPYSPDHIFDNVFDYSDNVSMTHGKHSLKFGVLFIKRQDNHFEANYPAGDISFSTASTAQTSLSGVATGSGLASFLLGYPSGYERDYALAPWHLRSTDFGIFVEDLIRVNDRLNLNAGLRYEIFTPLSETNNHISNYDVATQTLLVAGVNTNRTTIQGDDNNLGPRFGFAYALTADKTMSLRGGYGMFYIPSKTQGGTGGRLIYNAPFAITQAVSYDTSSVPVYTLGTPIPAPTVVNPNAPTGSVNMYQVHMRDSYAQQWNLDLQKQFATDWLFDMAYVGTRGLKLWNTENINEAVPGPAPLTSRYLITPNLSSISESYDQGNSIYHSLQVRGEKRLSFGLSFNAAYTWSKSIDSGGSSGTLGPQSQPQDIRNPHAERSLSTFDIRNRFVLSSLYAFPFGRGMMFLSSANRLEDALVGGWQLNGIFTDQTGLPFSPTISSNPANTNSAFLRPNRIGNGALPKGQRSIHDWFDISAFAVPAVFTYGNSKPNILTGPGTVNLDLSAFKSFVITEGTSLQFRAETFNFFNHPNFSNPATAIDAQGAGTITNTYNSGRELQLALKLLF